MTFLSKTITLWGFTKCIFISAILVVTLFFLLMWWANKAAKSAGESVLFDQIESIPSESSLSKSPQRVGLVFGCSKTVNGNTNLYFKYRIEAAYELWKAGKVRGFIVSGDNSRDDYNEPQDMKQALIEKGVSANKIICDYAGLRTMDSVVRVKQIFDINKVILVSQKFHNERAAYIAQNRGIDAIGYNAKDINRKEMKNREYLARIRMWTDENILNTKPKYLGKKEELTF